MRKKKQEDEYISLYSRLMSFVGIKLAERVVRLVCHFFCAPLLQTVGYILRFLDYEAILTHKNIIMQIVMCKAYLQRTTYHQLAIEIAKKNIPVPSYCFSFNGDRCVLCRSQLQLWRSKSKRSSRKTDSNDIDFGLTAVAITDKGSMKAKVFKKVCNRCSAVYGYRKYVINNVVTYTSRIKDSE